MRHDALAIMDAVIQGLFETHDVIKDSIWGDLTGSFAPTRLHPRPEATARVDLVAEWHAPSVIARLLKRPRPLIIGQQELRQAADLATSPRVVVIVDAINDARLLHSGSEWCSTATVVVPAAQQIICSVVVLGSGIGFYASNDGAGKCRRSAGRIEYAPASALGGTRKADEATLAFSGFRLRRVATIGGLLVQRMDDGDLGRPNPHVFVIEGNAALVKMTDRFGIDAVVEPLGQPARNVVAGAYICRQAGAAVLDLDGAPLDVERMADPSRGDELYAFVAARNHDLAVDLLRNVPVLTACSHREQRYLHEELSR